MAQANTNRAPKQERAIHTREQLLRAAAEVFDEYGYAGAGINKILQRAGVTAGALYFHFKDKQNLAMEVMNAQRGTIEPHVPTTGLQRLVDITLIWSHSLQADPMLRAGVRLTGEQAAFGLQDATPYAVWARSFEECLEAARAQGELREHVRIGELAEFVVGACTGMQEYAQVVSRRADLPRRTANMWRLLLPGVATDAALGGIENSEERALSLWTSVSAPAQGEGPAS
ncbi:MULTISPECIES: ScbR family autoregulator-binding transcription factor [Streptomyces]|uniref:AcrR family transcriptional regulator n=1 Tax=Streptomyces achromogenes TaxID=67255 RepID=A0ABU0Q3B1_STRAH|nr:MULTISPECIES: ScbR family autoregulator-binding transcription factor [Streptomyces]MDQ0685137.1 AcrR family transcriptional regulator [Streptomyces achromogenes]MDQ0960657.1 AcrR family transcriptional regulator [Streptomyces sp. B4I13]